MALTALTLLVGQLSDKVLGYLSVERTANDLHMVHLMPLPPFYLLLQ